MERLNREVDMVDILVRNVASGQRLARSAGVEARLL